VGIECPEEHMSDPQRQPHPDPRADRSTSHRGGYFGDASPRPAAGPERVGRARADRASGRARRTGPPRTGRRARQVPWPALARRQRSSEDLVDDALEEAIVELESVARVGKRILKRMPSGVVLSILHDYLTGRGRNNPDTRAGLGAIYRRIWILLGTRTTRRAT